MNLCQKLFNPASHVFPLATQRLEVALLSVPALGSLFEFRLKLLHFLLEGAPVRVKLFENFDGFAQPLFEFQQLLV